MGRGQMRNLETFGVGTGSINEFEYQKNQGELTEQLEHHGEKEDAAPEASTTAERVKQIMAEAHEKVEERKRKGISRIPSKAAAKKSAPKKQGTKKLTAKALSARKSAKKAASKKSAAKTSAKKSATKKSAARKLIKKSATGKSAKKSATRESTKNQAAKQSKTRKR